MAKQIPVYVCSKCDAQSPKWSGRCSVCDAWGSISKDPVIPGPEEPAAKSAPGDIKTFAGLDQTQQALHEPTGFDLMDLILGGGLVKGSVVLLAGEPGMGKSTLLSQLALLMARQKKILYITGEESPYQVQLRLSRLNLGLTENLFFLNDTRAEVIISTLEKETPQLTIIDSIQSISTDNVPGEAGSLSQVKAGAALLTQAAKKFNTTLVMVGQVTKDGDIAGPRALEHLVDTVLSLEGERMHRFRILRAIKNRFGSTDQTVLLDMDDKGLRIVSDPSEALLEGRAANTCGSAIGCLLEGRRPLLVELQALVTSAGYSSPVRRATGLDSSRLNMLLAVLTRHAGVMVYDKDVFANAAGGLEVKDPAADLALAAAIASAVNKKALEPKTAYFGEVGLTGELRPVALPDLRIKEFKRMGFTKVICPKIKNIKAQDIQVIQCETIKQALN